MSHAQGTYDRARAIIRETGATVPATNVSPNAAGREWVAPTKFERAAKEAAASFEAIADAVASGEFITSADKDALIGKYIEAASAKVEAANEWADEVNEKRAEGEALGSELIAEGKSDLLDALDVIEEAAWKVGKGQALRSAARDNNPVARFEQSLHARPFATGALGDLRAAVAAIDLPAARYLRQDEFRKWRSGVEARDVGGVVVPGDYPAACVRLTHAPRGPLMAVTARGGVV
jgi:hypothetical protein